MRMDPALFKKCRERLLMSRTDVAYKSGVSYGSVCSIENGGRVGVSTMSRLLAALDMDLGEALEAGILIDEDLEAPPAEAAKGGADG